jgi:hypothetical protein
MRTHSISNRDDIIDSRDVIAHIEELRDELTEATQTPEDTMTTVIPRTRIAVIADNGGGLTLQIYGHNRYARHYYSESSARDLAHDLLTLARGGRWEAWVGNAAGEIWEERDAETERNGGYLWYAGSAHEVVRALISVYERAESAQPWPSISGLAKQLAMMGAVHVVGPGPM